MPRRFGAVDFGAADGLSAGLTKSAPWGRWPGIVGRAVQFVQGRAVQFVQGSRKRGIEMAGFGPIPDVQDTLRD